MDEHVNSGGQKYDILIEGLPITDHQGIPEATAIRYGIENRQIQRQRRHERHHQQGQEGRIPPVHPQ